MGDNLDCKIYSDMIARINSYNQRKIKSLLITSKNIYIFEPSNSIVLDCKLKKKVPLDKLVKLTVPKKNGTLVLFTFEN